MEIAIRHAVPEDWPVVHEIFQQDHVLAGTQRLPYAAPAAMQARLAPKPGLIQLVAEVAVDGAPPRSSASPSSSPSRSIRATTTWRT